MVANCWSHSQREEVTGLHEVLGVTWDGIGDIKGDFWVFLH
jgi:hypothetical protein